ncbi:MAG: glycosyltransferase [Candidatus Aminicenantes bacterium]|jgi:glycosyltransferase involved in cell wall biosynthesis
MNVSVIICTHNRSSFLLELLSSFKDQTVSPSEYELIVIDNASSDNTKEVVCNASRDLRNLRYFYEPELGISRARNTGVKNAKGDIIAFIDDDALPESNWLEVLINTFQTVTPVPVGVGGKILPQWEVPKPAWVPDNKILQSLSLIDWGDQPHWIPTPSLSAGNLALRKIAFNKVGEFNISLGRIGNKMSSMEEILFLFLMLQEFGSQSLLYQPEAVVNHRIPKDRIANRRYIIRRSYWDGFSKAMMKIIISQMDFNGKLDLSSFQMARYKKRGVLAGSVMRFARGSISGLQAIFRMDRKKLTECLIHMAFGLGGMIGLAKHFFFSSDAGVSEKLFKPL